MTTKQTASQLRLAADIIETGHPWEYNTPSGWRKPLIGEKPLWMVSHGWGIRLILATPPDNCPLHKPADPYAELKAAHKEGKVLQQKYQGGGHWIDYTGLGAPSFNSEYHEWRIKPSTPAFQLPPPPPGMQWHRTDGWTAEMLPQGYRPLVAGEKLRKDSDSFKNKCGELWEDVCGLDGREPVLPETCFYRTTRPLTFAHEGKTWTWHRPGDPMPCDGGRIVEWLTNKEVSGKVPFTANHLRRAEILSWTCGSIFGWRYADEPKFVELGPEDVPPWIGVSRSR